MNNKSNNRSIKPQTTNISNISHGNITIAEQSPDNSNLNFNFVENIAPAVLTPLTTTQNYQKNVYENNYCNTIQTPVESNTAANYPNTVGGNNTFYPLQRNNVNQVEKNIII